MLLDPQGFGMRLSSAAFRRIANIMQLGASIMKKPRSRTRRRERPLSGRRTKIGPARRTSPGNITLATVARRRKGTRPARRSIGQPQAVPGLAAGASPDARQIRGVLDQLARAQAELTARGIDLLNVAHAIGRNAVATFMQALVNSLVQDNLLHDLEQLRTALAATPLSADLRLLPEATLNWLCRHLDLSQHLQPGQELEVPAAQLSQYDLPSPTPDSVKPLVNLQVAASGWKYRGQTVIRPRVVVTAPPLPATKM